MKNLIAFDFSMSKPAACMLMNNSYHFFSWPKSINEKYKNIFIDSGVNICDRTKDAIMKDNMQSEIQNASNLANDIIITLEKYLNNISYVGFEGLSYASKGNVTLSLSGWRYIFQYALSEFVPLDHMYTYSPITCKSIAGCAKRGMGKGDMINEFIKSGPTCKFRVSLFERQDQFMKKGGKNWIDNVDDFIDAFWVLRTLQIKEKLEFSL